MLITDSQIHIWGADSPSRPWPEGHGKPHRVPPVTAIEVAAEMDKAGVARAIIVPPSWEGDRNDVALQAARDFPTRFAVMGRIDLTSPGSVDLVHWLDTPGMLGIRLMIHPASAPPTDWFWPAAAAAGIPLMVAAPGRTAWLGTVAAAFPDLRLIIDHMGLGFASPSEIEPRVKELIETAKLPNVAVKVSAFPQITGESAPFPSLQPILLRVVEAFGADRCMWGSDLTGLPCPYSDWVRALTEADYLSEGDKALIMGGSLSRWLNWPDA